MNTIGEAHMEIECLVITTPADHVDVLRASVRAAFGLCLLTSISDVALAQEVNWSGPYGGSDLGHRTKWCSRTYESFAIAEDAQHGGFRTEKRDATHHTSIRYDETGRIARIESTAIAFPTIGIYKYDDAGVWIERFEDEKGVRFGRTRILTDKAARIVEAQFFKGTQERPTSTTKYRYDTFGRANVIGDQVQLLRKYDSAGRVREIQIGQRRNVFRYGEKGEPRAHLIYLGGVLEEVREFFVDTEGKIVAQLGRRQKGLITSSATYSYDGKGNLVSDVSWTTADEFEPSTPGLKYLTRTTYSYECWPGGKAPPANCNLLGDCP
jgi:hypothetical protein